MIASSLLTVVRDSRINHALSPQKTRVPLALPVRLKSSPHSGMRLRSTGKSTEKSTGGASGTHAPKSSSARRCYAVVMFVKHCANDISTTIFGSYGNRMGACLIFLETETYNAELAFPV